MIGKVLNQTYRLEKALSEGGMGQVYIASHLRIPNRRFAVKRLRPELAASERFLARFRIEAQAMMALEHNNIVRIEDFLEEDHTYYLVMEFVKGRPLDEILYYQKKLSLGQTLSITLQILDALDCCHQKQIIHRDLKPSNVLVEESGQIKLTDFGIALQEDVQSRLTNTGTLLGTPDYMSPEQITAQPLDGRCDLYALGVIMYEMLVGRTPFPRMTESDGAYVVLFAHVQNPPPPINDASVPAFLIEATMCALAKHPTARYASAKEMRNFLQQHLPSEGWLYSSQTRQGLSALAKGIKNDPSAHSLDSLAAVPNEPQSSPVTPQGTASFQREKAAAAKQPPPASPALLPSAAKASPAMSTPAAVPSPLVSKSSTNQHRSPPRNDSLDLPAKRSNSGGLFAALMGGLFATALLVGAWLWLQYENTTPNLHPQKSPAERGISPNQAALQSDPKKNVKDSPALAQQIEKKALSETPTPRRDIEMPTPRRDTEIPPPRRDTETPPPRRDIETPTPRRDIEIPPPRRDSETPPPPRDRKKESLTKKASPTKQPTKRTDEEITAEAQNALKSMQWPSKVREFCEVFLNTCFQQCYLSRAKLERRETPRRRTLHCKRECWMKRTKGEAQLLCVTPL
jgi:serine/threonine protein kinase